jgi:hypothetical protein
VTRPPGQEGYTVGGDVREAMLWAVPFDQRTHVLLPGYKAINNWSGHFAPNRTTTAQQYFGHAFEMEPGPSKFAVGAPAQAQADEGTGGLVLSKRGRLSGFRT